MSGPSGAGGGCAVGRVGGSSVANVMAPTVGRFSGSDAQRAHVAAIKRANEQASHSIPQPVSQELAVKSHLDAIKERKAKEEEDRRLKRESARAKRHDETSKRDLEEEQALDECEAQAREDCESNAGLKYEAALVVRIAVRFGVSGAWMKISEARARGAEIPLDPRRIYLLAHPDKCRLPEAADATAILNAQRPPEMSEARLRPAARAAAPAVSTARTAEAAASEPVAQEAHFEAAPVDAHLTCAPFAEERRQDPEDGELCTLTELQEKYQVQYTDDEIQVYWQHECKLAAASPPDAAGTAASVVGSAGCAAVAAPAAPEVASTTIKPAVAKSRRY